VGKRPEGAQEVSDGGAADGEDGSKSEQGEAEEGGAGEGRGKEGKEGEERTGEFPGGLLDLEARPTCLGGLSLTNLSTFALGQTAALLRR